MDDRRYVQLDDHFARASDGRRVRRNEFDTNLPEEQATEFEKFDNFTQLLRGVATEADTQFGITDKRFRFTDFNMFISDEWHATRSLTLNLGVRYEFFGWPEEMDGRIGNVDFDAISDTENPVASFIVPSNVQNTGYAAIDSAIAASRKVDNKHTLNGQDWNNIAPRVGFAWTPSASNKWVVRGGYGIFFDRPSAAFINTVFSNYPFLREQEVTFPAARFRSSVPGRSRIRPSRSINTCRIAFVRTVGCRPARIRFATART